MRNNIVFLVMKCARTYYVIALFDLVVKILKAVTLTSPPSLSLSLFSALYYVKVMKKVLDKGVEYIQTEHERLGRILSQLQLAIHTCITDCIDVCILHMCQ